MRSFGFLLSIFIVFTIIPVYSAELPNKQFDGSQAQFLQAKEELEYYGIIDSNNGWTGKEKMTRREVVQIVSNIMGAEEAALFALQIMDDRQEDLGFKDIPKGSQDEKLLAYLVYENVFLGQTNAQGEKIAALDEPITNWEALAILIRMLLVGTYETPDSFDSSPLIATNNDENWPFILSARCGINNSENLADTHGVKIAKEEAKEIMTVSNFLRLAYRSLYVPRLLVNSSLQVNYYIETVRKNMIN